MSRTARSSRRRRRRPFRRFILCLLAVAMVAAAAKWMPGMHAPSQPDQPALAQQGDTAAMKLTGPVEGTALLTQAWIYGTHLGLEGALPQTAVVPQGLQLVLRTAAGEETSWPLQMTQTSEGVSFTLSEQINGGLELETLAEGGGCLLVQAQGETAVQYYLLQATESVVGDLPFAYYTVTRPEGNRLIQLQQASVKHDGAETDGLLLQCAAAALPENVYDVVIDAGHGGTDAGSVSGGVHEADVVLDIALRTRKQLQALGLKVCMTRDGTEAPNTMMAYTMYDEDGRVNVIGGSGAKLCLSLHLNSYDGALAQGGVQVYAAAHMDYSFAARLAATLAQQVGSVLSPMDAYRVGDGVYCRTFTQADVDELAAEGEARGFEPYRQPVGTNYYYIIRETGGRVTGAYIDGRHPHYGENRYRDSAVGVETYLCELGYLTSDADLQRLLNAPDSYAAGLAAAVAQRFGLSA